MVFSPTAVGPFNRAGPVRSNGCDGLGLIRPPASVSADEEDLGDTDTLRTDLCASLWGAFDEAHGAPSLLALQESARLPVFDEADFARNGLNCRLKSCASIKSAMGNFPSPLSFFEENAMGEPPLLSARILM